MTTEHTPKPWVAIDAAPHMKLDWPNGKLCIADKTFGYIAEAWCHTNEQTTRANARLIAAAPELLEIVEDIAPPDGDEYSNGFNCDECGTPRATPDQTQCDVPGCFYVRIREAIRKAKYGG